ncbi:MAG: hypothetical protein Udaeo2_06470 [Candidatus Udaeobacter sp.]|nr:MAG: hypothetical protein Udaeo2_06470 [Candidatus Udaeobacter sp.]
MRAHINGVSVRDTRPEARMATMIVTENSRKMRPSSPGMKTSGMKTAASERVIDRIVKEISPALLNVAFRIDSPCSARRTTFSKNTIASSTRKPIASVSAINVRLLMEKSSMYITATVRSSDIGNATAGISVSVARPRKT